MIIQREIERQDFVDGAIHKLLEELAGHELPWNIEWIGAVRDAVQNSICEECGMAPKDFYWFETFSEMFPEI